MALPEPPAERHRAIAGRSATGSGRHPMGWDAPAPVAGWTARDVVDHLSLVSRVPGGGHGVDVAAGPAPDEDPVAAWLAHADAVQAVLDDPARPSRPFDDPHMGSCRWPDRSTGSTPPTSSCTPGTSPEPPARTTGSTRTSAPSCWPACRAIEEMLRASGQYGPAVPVPDDADVQTRMLGFIGRDPDWQPPGREAPSAGPPPGVP